MRSAWAFAASIGLLAACGPENNGTPGDVDASVTPPADGPNNVCDPYQPRDPAPKVLIGPGTVFKNAILAEINAAQTDISLLMYQFGDQSFVDALVAAQKRGVNVRVVVDGNQSVNDSPKQQLTAAGVGVKNAPAVFTNAHAKTMVIDGREAVILSGNFNQYTMQSERNYGVIDLDANDVADAKAVFEADWSGNPTVDLACSRLVVSPVNSKTRLLDLVKNSKTKLDFEVMYLSDTDIVAAVKQRKAAGVAIRVLLADPGWISGNSDSAKDLAASGITVKYLSQYEVHAKLVIADGVAFVGSENFSYTSLVKNRELGVFVKEPDSEGQIATQYDKDWQIGTAAQ